MKKILKKSLSVFLTVALLCSMLVVPAAAATDTVTLGFANGTWDAENKNYTVDITLTGNGGDFDIYAGEIYVAFDNTVLELSKCVTSGLVADGVNEDGDPVAISVNRSTNAKSNQQGYLTVTWNDGSAINHPMVSGQTILKVTFALKENVESGTTDISFTAPSGKKNMFVYSDVNGAEASHTVVSTSVDNVEVVGVAPTLSTVALDKATVTVNGTDDVTGKASATSTSNKDVTSLVTWSVTPPENGTAITVGADGSFTVPAKAKAGTYTVTAAPKAGQLLGDAKTTTLTVNRNTYEAQSVAIYGYNRTSIDGGEPYDFHTYDLEVVNQYSETYTPAAVEWSVTPANEGVSVNQNGTVSFGADISDYVTKQYTGETDDDWKPYTIKATVDGVSDELVLGINRYTYLDRIYIYNGQDRVIAPVQLTIPVSDQPAEDEFTAKLFDQFGEEIAYDGIVWATEGTIPAGVTVNGGVVSVSKNASVGEFYLTAYAKIDRSEDLHKVKIMVSELNANWDEVIINYNDGTYGMKNSELIMVDQGSEMRYSVNGVSGTLSGAFEIVDGDAVQKIDPNGNSVTVKFTADNDDENGEYKGLELTHTYSVTIDPKSVTVSGIGAYDKTYDGTNAATLNYSGVNIAGKLDGDDLSVTATGTFDYTDADIVAGNSVTLEDLKLVGADAANYVLNVKDSTTQTTAMIKPRKITVTANDATKVYGDANPTFDFTVPEGALVEGDTKADLSVALTTAAVESSPVKEGGYAITGSDTASGMAGDNYEVTVTPGVLTVTPKTLTVAPGTLTVTKIYDGTKTAAPKESATGALALTGVINGDDVSVAYTTIGDFADADAGENKAVTISGLSLSGAAAGNYAITATEQLINSGKITKAALTADKLTLSNNAVTYDGTAKTVTVTLNAPYTGMGAVTIFYNGKEAAPSEATESGSNGYEIQVTAEEGDNFSALTRYLVVGYLTIAPKSISGVTVTPDKESYEYTGSAITPAITVTDPAVAVATLVENTDYTVAYSNNTDVGMATVTVTGKGNYTGEKTATFEITRQEPKVTDFVVSSIEDLTYDGEAHPVTVKVKDGVDGMGTFKVLYNGAEAAPKNAATYTVTLAVAEGDNYDDEVLTLGEFTIAPKSISGVTVADIASVTYTGKAHTPTPEVKDGTTVLVKDADYTITYDDNTAAGTAAVTFTGKGNYTGTRELGFTIEKASLTVKANDQTVGYGTELGAKSVTYTGFVNGETESVLGGTLDFDTTYTTTSPVGQTYSVTPKGLTSDNYTITFQPGVITVTAKNLADEDVTVADIAAVTYNGSAYTPTPEVKNGQTALVKDTDYTIAYDDNTAAGTATVTFAGKGNYTGTKTTQFTIHKLEAQLTWSGYDALVYTGTNKSVTAVVANKCVGDEVNVTVTGGAEKNAGTDYEAVASALTGAEAANYALPEAKTQAYAIAKAPLTLGAVTVADKVYNGKTDDAKVTAVAFTGLQNGETLTLGTDFTVTAAYTGADAGDSSAVTGTVTLAATAKANNYSLANGAYSTTGKVAKATTELSISAANAAYTGANYAESKITKTSNVDDVVNYTYYSDAACTVPATPKNVGTYYVKGTIAETTNNTAAEAVDSFQITKVDLTVKAKDHAVTYGQAPADNGVEYTGFVSGENAGVLGGTLTYDHTYTQYGKVGTYTITPKGLTSGNYNITFRPGKLTVGQKEVSLTWTGAGTLYYDGQAKNVTAAADGLVNGDVVAVTVSGGKQTAIGSYTAAATGLTGEKAGNYKLPSAASMAYTIAPALTEVTVSLDTVTATIDGLTIKLVGYRGAEETVTVTGGGQTAADGKLTVNGVEYKIDATGVVVNTTSATISEAVVVAPAANADATITQTVLDSVAQSTVTGLQEAVAEAVLAAAGKDNTIDNVHVELLIQPRTYSSVDEKQNLILDIKPVVTYEDSSDNPVGSADQVIANSSIKAPITISVKLPDGFHPTVAKHELSGGKFEYLHVDVVGGVATWEQHGFSAVYLIDDNRSATVEYRFDNGSTQTVTYAPEHLEQALPTDSRTGYTFNGWQFKDASGTNVGAVVKGNLTDALLTALSGATDPLTAEPQFTVVNNSRPTGSGSSTTKYTIRAAAGAGGTITPSGNVGVVRGEDQTFTFKADAGYIVKEVKVDGKVVAAASSYTFLNVKEGHTIEVTFQQGEQAKPFTDVSENAYYYDAVLWAVERGITSGMTATTFVPNATCNRGQMVTFLWRAAGQPEPASTVNPFTDVAPSAYYYKAVLWAVEQGITNGTTATTFAPGAPCNRGQMATFLWRAEGKQAPAAANTFADVKTGMYYYDAVLWAAENGITTGKTATTFAPGDACTRGQMVTFLYRSEQAK